MDKQVQIIAEYSPDSTTECNSCKKLIEQSQLRIGYTLEDKPYWKHQLCWTVPENIKSIKDIHKDMLNHEDLKNLESYIDKKIEVPNKSQKLKDRQSDKSPEQDNEEPSIEHKSKKNKASKIKRAESSEIPIRKSQRLYKAPVEA